jgi:hypothetical protein
MAWQKQELALFEAYVAWQKPERVLETHMVIIMVWQKASCYGEKHNGQR